MSVDATRAAATLRHLSSLVTGVAADASLAELSEALWFQSELLGVARDPIIAVDRHRAVIYWNPAAEELFGWTAAEALGRSSRDLISRTETAETTATIEDAMRRGASWTGDYQVQQRSGRPISIQVTNRPVLDRDGRLVAVIGIGIDTTERQEAEEARRQLAAIVNGSGDAIFSSTPEGITTSWNAAAERLFGFTRDEMVGTPVARIAPGNLLDEQVQMRARLRRGGPPERLETVRVRRDRTLVEVLIAASPMTDADGRVVGLSVIAHDVSKRKEAERTRAAAELRFEIGFEQSGIGAAILDLDGIPTRVNAAACKLLGRPSEQLVGRRWTEYTHPDDPPLGERVTLRMEEGHDHYQDERRYLRPDGTVAWASTHVTLVRSASHEPQYYSAQFQDITYRKQMEGELNHQALHDALTGLPNRALLMDRLERRLSTPTSPAGHLAVIAVDVDHLKALNDGYGRAAGDALLRDLSDRIAAASGPRDTVSRCGGKQFVVACKVATVGESQRIGERILAAIGQHPADQRLPEGVTASIGIAIADASATPESLLRDADIAMHRARARGRGRIELFDQALRAEIERTTATTSALRTALERREFVVHYQPVVDLATGEVVSCEALVRWERPGHGLVGPNDFIALAEDTGLILPIGAWVLEEACRQLAVWQRRRPTMTVAVNLSVRQFSDPDIVGQIRRVLARTELAAASLCLELTETVLMDDVRYFAPMLADLRGLGVRLSIDDFGTGYSSLSYLAEFPVDAIKVDRSFTDGLGTDHHSAIVAAIIALADALDLEVTAEGVETADQFAILSALKCRRAQGYYLARPMPAAALTTFLEEPHHWPASERSP